MGVEYIDAGVMAALRAVAVEHPVSLRFVPAPVDGDGFEWQAECAGLRGRGEELDGALTGLVTALAVQGARVFLMGRRGGEAAPVVMGRDWGHGMGEEPPPEVLEQESPG